ncbi:disease resistance protein RPV1-like [Actinidia eriantha]|uniref:disease resistance protein RPV1-like n=1 Tax=Actinidia eriantha TaxID=165200 RepID=UPI00258285DD|nr:disease resistance protein RPV1-like [Actinidia eriantha]
MAAVTSQEASSSIPAAYHVFLSFRGEDTRKNFTDHLYTALVQAGFRTFRDDDEIARGENINLELQKAIMQSSISIVVFSKNYASSRWCLDELVMILERKRTSKHEVLPVFYDVDPSQVRKQMGNFAEAFARHERRLKAEAGGRSNEWKDKVKRWRAALREAADLGGMVLQNQADGHESKFIQKIVLVVEDKLNRTALGVAPFLIGIYPRVKNLNLWLRDGSTDVGMVAICGMGGIGKTTIAKFVYNLNFKRFEGSSFLANIREVSEQPNGLAHLQRQLISDILNGRKEKIFNVHEGIVKIRDAVSYKRVLLVLDDVDQVDQLDAILGMRDWFYPGSKIIITTRNEHLLKAHKVYKVHKIEKLDGDESFELFNWHAFGQDHPLEGYMEHSRRIVHHCGGLPLALRVLGSSLSGKGIDIWESALEKLEAIPDGQILRKLKISFDSLQDDHDQNLFLHIACFFVGKDKDCTVKILDGCDFYTMVGIQNLIDRCLLTIDNYKKILMHQLLRDMGREIVRQESPKKPGKRSRLWHHKDSFTEVNSNEIVLEINALARMYELRLLQLCYVQLSGSYEEFPKKLRWLCWRGFPLESIPSDFPVESLVALDMRYSSLKQVWRGTKFLGLLKILNLSHSHSLAKTPDFSVLPNLERLILKDCTSLLDVHESIGNLDRLVFLNLKDCKNLTKLPLSIIMLKSLETLIISGCSKLDELPTELRKLESLKVFAADGISINQLLATTGEVKSQQALVSMPRRSPEISWVSLPHSLVSLSLADCNLSDDAFPRDFSNLFLLQNLNLSKNPISTLPDFVRGLTGLQTLRLESCTKLQSLVVLSSVKKTDVSDCSSLKRITCQSLLPIKEIAVNRCYNLVEFQYCFKIEPLGEVDTEMINILGLPDLASLENIEVDFANSTLGLFYTETRPIQHDRHHVQSLKVIFSMAQGLHEYGLFSTFFPGREVPSWFSHRSTGSSLSFTVRSLPNLRVRGINVCSVYAFCDEERDYKLPHPLFARISNKSKGLKWIYGPSCLGVPEDDEVMIWLSHWKLGNQLDCGDEVSVSIFMDVGFEVKECGIKLVYEQENTSNPSQKGVIDGDLSDYEVMTGTYFLCAVISKVYDWSSSDWFNKLNENSEETIVFTENEGRRAGQLTVAAAGIGSNDGGGHCRGQKARILVAVFFLSLSSLALLSLGRKRQATKKEKKK